MDRKEYLREYSKQYYKDHHKARYTVSKAKFGKRVKDLTPEEKKEYYHMLYLKNKVGKDMMKLTVEKVEGAHKHNKYILFGATKYLKLKGEYDIYYSQDLNLWHCYYDYKNEYGYATDYVDTTHTEEGALEAAKKHFEKAFNIIEQHVQGEKKNEKD